MDLTRYPGKIVLINESTTKIRVHWDFRRSVPGGGNFPDEIDLYGMSWTTQEAATVEQLLKIRACGMVKICDPELEKRGAFPVVFAFGLEHLPLIMKPEDSETERVELGEPIAMRRDFYGEITFEDRRDNSEQEFPTVPWKPFPGHIRIRVDLMGKPKGKS